MLWSTAGLRGPSPVPSLGAEKPVQPAPGASRLAAASRARIGIDRRLGPGPAAGVWPASIGVLLADEKSGGHTRWQLFVVGPRETHLRADLPDNLAPPAAGEQHHQGDSGSQPDCPLHC